MRIDCSCWYVSCIWRSSHRRRFSARLLDDALREYQTALDALKTDDLIGYQQHLQKTVADLQQADQLEHRSPPSASGAPPASPPPG